MTSGSSPTLKTISAAIDVLTGRRSLQIQDAFRVHGHYVAGVAFRLMGRDDDVDDVVQDVFLHAMSKIRQLNDLGAIRAWLATVTVRVVRRRFRFRRVRTMLGLESHPASETLTAPGVSPDDRAVLAQVYQVLDELTANDRIAWALRYVDGRQLEEIAALCGCSLATAKRRIAAAQQALDEVFS